MTLLSQDNPHYKFSQITELTNIEKYKDNITTFYVVEGKLEFIIDNQNVEINSAEGLLVSSKSIIKNLKKEPGTIAFEVISNKTKSDLIEFVDKENIVVEENISSFKILKNHKKVILFET